MRMSEAGLNLLKRSEGYRGRVYMDIAGVRTIGYGHRLLPGETFADGITMAAGDVLLAKDLAIAEANVERLVKVPLTQGQFDALVDFVFNLGSGRLASSTLLKYLNANNYKEAGLQLLEWDHSGSVIVVALETRRKAEFALFNEEEEHG
jgi:lysozyme